MAETITKDLRAFRSSELMKLRNTIFFKVPPDEHNFLPPHAFLPDDKIKIIIDNLYSIIDVPDILALVGGNPLLDNHHGHLLLHCQMLREEFKWVHAEKTTKRKVPHQSANTAVIPSNEPNSESESLSDSNEKEESIPLVLEYQSDSGELKVNKPTTSLKWKIKFWYERYPQQTQNIH